MTPLSRDVLSRTLRSPVAVTRFSMSDWDTLVRQARAAGLLARLAHRFRQHELTGAIPSAARWHFDAAETLADKQRIAVRWELQQLRDALADLDSPLIVLKGAAYVAADLPAAAGRLFNDIDILVPRDVLPRAESSLMLAGWHATGLSEYDKRYYRRWMHEIPPMQHVQRDTVIDVHHAILPDTARYHPDSAKLRNRAVAADGLPGVSVLAAEDRILHSATHLFHDGELPHGLRDLTDLDLLLRDAAAADRDFWPRLTARADELQLSRPLFYALRYLRHFLDTPVPDGAMAALETAAPNRATLALMDRIFT
ncbi:MAG: nucleotidyltransferase family protein, partial [Candidatus Thermoplasmatota archaeon]|nr:nucleotidyltransferase family protein [Candidatus Thermoplasmatota archaeon]